MFDPKEVDLINRYVKKRDDEMAERRESIRRSSIDAAVLANATRRAMDDLGLDGEGLDPPSTGITSPEVLTGGPSSPPSAAVTISGKGTAREVHGSRCRCNPGRALNVL